MVMAVLLFCFDLSFCRIQDEFLRKSSVSQLCPTVWDPMDCSPPGPSVHGISLARTLDWVALLSSWGPSRPRDRSHVSCIDGWILYHWATREFFQTKTSPQNKTLLGLWADCKPSQSDVRLCPATPNPFLFDMSV